MDFGTLAGAIDAPVIIAEWCSGSAGRVLAATQHAQALVRHDFLERPLHEVLRVQKGVLQPGSTSEVTTCRVQNALGVTTQPLSLRWRCDCRRWDPGPGQPSLLFINLADLSVVGQPGSSPSCETAETDGGGRAPPALASEEVEEQQELVALSEVKIEKLHILLVEDDIFSVRVISELCRQCEFEVETCSNGEQCLAALEANALLPPAARFNLVMCDVMMHGMNGMQVWRSRSCRYTAVTRPLHRRYTDATTATTFMQVVKVISSP